MKQSVDAESRRDDEDSGRDDARRADRSTRAARDGPLGVTADDSAAAGARRLVWRFDYPP